jgi:hypothetical protein
MGQAAAAAAVADTETALADPLHAPPALATPGSADDLLSRLAGEEIDRMLAEADAPAAGDERASQDQAPDRAPDSAAASAAPPALTDADLHAALSQAQADVTAPPAVQPGLAATHAPPPPMRQSGASDSAIKPAQPLSGAALIDQAKPLGAAAPEEPTSAEERAALTTIQAIAESVKKDQVLSKSGPASEVDAPDARDPIYIRLLELLNAPLKACPDGVRDALGKVAILTLMNSVGVLVYLLLFRR